MLRSRPKRFPEVLWWRTYTNLAYLLLGLPLGILYFVSIVVGFAFGTVLAVVAIGVPLLLLTIFLVWNYASLERSLALVLTGVEIPEQSLELPSSLVARARILVARSVFWKALAFLLGKLVLGVLGFVVAIVLWAPSLVLLSAPWTMNGLNIFIGSDPWVINGLNVAIGSYQGVLTKPQTWALALIGLGMTMIATRFTNIIAPLFAQLAAFALTDTQLENESQKSRLTSISLASQTANLASSFVLSGKLQTHLEIVLRSSIEAVNGSAGAILVEPNRINVNFAPHAINALLEVGAIEGTGKKWKRIEFMRGYTIRPKNKNDAIWQSLAIMPMNKGMLIVRFEQSTPKKAELEFLATIADQISISLENARLIAVAQSQAALEERHRLARELHDSVSQALFGIALGARTAKAQLERDPAKAHEPLDYVLQLAEAGVTEMRALIFELRPEILEQEGLVAALNKQAEMMRLRYNLEMETHLGTEPNVPLETKQTLLRIAQEALHNTVKHAKASKACLELENNTLVISDNGIGFDTTQNFSSSLGQRTMRERAVAIGAEYTLESSFDSGTRIRVSLSSN